MMLHINYIFQLLHGVCKLLCNDPMSVSGCTYVYYLHSLINPINERENSAHLLIHGLYREIKQDYSVSAHTYRNRHLLLQSHTY